MNQPDPNAVKLPFNPCPFCGNYPEYCLNFSKNLIELACRECNARFALFIEAKYFETNGKDFLSTRWNRRAPSVEEELDSMPDWEKMYREREAEAKLDLDRADQLEDLYIAAQREIESLRKKLEVAKDCFVILRSNPRWFDKQSASGCGDMYQGLPRAIKYIDETLAQLSESKDVKQVLFEHETGFHNPQEVKSPMRCPCCGTDDLATIACMNTDCECSLEQFVEAREVKLKAEVESLTKDIIYYRDLWMKRINSDDAIEEERDQLKVEVEKLTRKCEASESARLEARKERSVAVDESYQLRAEQSQLKEKLGKALAALKWMCYCRSTGCDCFGCRTLQLLSTPPSQEQSPNPVMKSMYEALQKTLEHLHPYNTPEVTIDRIVEAMRLYEYMEFSQEQSKEVIPQDSESIRRAALSRYINGMSVPPKDHWVLLTCIVEDLNKWFSAMAK